MGPSLLVALFCAAVCPPQSGLSDEALKAKALDVRRALGAASRLHPIFDRADPVVVKLERVTGEQGRLIASVEGESNVLLDFRDGVQMTLGERTGRLLTYEDRRPARLEPVRTPTSAQLGDEAARYLAAVCPGEDVVARGASAAFTDSGTRNVTVTLFRQRDGLRYSRDFDVQVDVDAECAALRYVHAPNLPILPRVQRATVSRDRAVSLATEALNVIGIATWRFDEPLELVVGVAKPRRSDLVLVPADLVKEGKSRTGHLFYEGIIRSEVRKGRYLLRVDATGERVIQVTPLGA